MFKNRFIMNKKILKNALKKTLLKELEYLKKNLFVYLFNFLIRLKYGDFVF